MDETPKIACCRVTTGLLRVLGVFPPKGKEINPGKKFRLVWPIRMILSSLTFVGCCTHLFKNLKDHLYYHVDIDIAIILSMSSTYLFSICFFLRIKHAVHLYFKLSDFSDGKPINFDENNKLMDKAATGYLIYIEFLIIALLTFSNVIKTDKCKRENLEYGLNEVCGLFTYTEMPFDIDYFPVKQIYVAFQLLGTHYTYLMAGIVSWLSAETMVHMIIRLRHAKHLFLEAINEKDPRAQRKMFNKAAYYHDKVLNLEYPFNKTFGIFMFSHLAMTAPILGTAFVSIVYGGSGSSLFICLGWFIATAKDSFIGQRLQDESVMIATAIYDSDWYNCNLSIQRDILFVLMRCGRPMYPKAASFGVLDHVMFLGILKATYSYITLLLQTL